MRALGFVLACLFVTPAADAGIKLKAIRFPSKLGAAGGTTTPPVGAPLGQTIVFEFDGKPNINGGVADGLPIRIDVTNSLGQDVGRFAFGTYKVKDNKIIFNPRLPSSALPSGFGPQSDNESDASLPGLLPETVYSIDVSIGGPNSIPNLTKVAKSVVLPVKFQTMPTLQGDFAIKAYYNNAPSKAAEVKKKKIKPTPGIDELYPNPFEDTAGLFTSIPSSNRAPFKLVFDGPLNPSNANISSDTIRLRATADATGAPVDLAVTADVVLTSNEIKKSKVYVFPSGILPLGHTIEVQISDKLESLSGAVVTPGPMAPVYKKVAKYRVALDPDPGSPVDDRIIEDFDTNEAQDTSIVAQGLQLASWDSQNSNHLRAAFGFGGDGSLGRFLAPDEAIVINLDTDFQQFPLFSGATPDVTPGTSVSGGVFAFTDFHLPPKATLRIRGTNPVIITCTGDVLIEGLIDLNGANGTRDDTFDSAITPQPGGTAGAGGGKGGDSHPVVVPSGAQSLNFIQTPQFGQSGFGPFNTPGGGAGGGQCGASLPWIGFASTPNCANFGATGDGSRGSGGGGGSLNVYFPLADGAQDPNVAISGRRGAIGIGNHLPVVFDPDETPIPIAPEPGTYQATPGNPTNALARVNPNPTFDQAYKDGLIWDKGQMNVDESFWAKTHNVTFGGTPGPLPFQDADPENNYIGAGGELQTLIGGQGGGGAGSRTEGSTYICRQSIFLSLGLPFTVNDAKGGGGGGGGGGMLLQAIGTITFAGPNARIEATGGNGAGGEQTGGSNRGGSSGGGSGGVVILQSAADVLMNDAGLQSVVIDVSAGCGHDATNLSPSNGTGLPGGDSAVLQVGDGSPGGPGLVQIHVPDDSNIVKSKISADHFATALNIKCSGSSNGTSPFDPLVDTSKTPTPLTSRSVARSVWYDLGAVTSDFRPPIVTPAGALDGPIYGVPGQGPFFRGTDPLSGDVMTDDDGFVLDPFNNDIEVDSPDLLLADYIPSSAPNFQTVNVLFQGADEDAANPGTPDLATMTPLVADITQLNGKRFLRWQVSFDIATNELYPSGPTTPLPQVNMLRIPFKY